MNFFAALSAALGAVSICAGAALIYRPLGLLALGALLLLLSFASARRKKTS